MATAALGAAAASATAAAISAAFAGATSVAAWFTIRGRRPKLIVETEVGNPRDGVLKPDPEGVAMSVRVINVRDVDVEVLDLWFEGPDQFRSRVPIWRKRSLWRSRVSLADHWFVDGAGTIPGTVKAHHTELYAFRTDQLGAALHEDGRRAYRAVVSVAGGSPFRGRWLEVDAGLGGEA